MPEAWFCPACQAFHAPHVETCPQHGARQELDELGLCNLCQMHGRCMHGTAKCPWALTIGYISLPAA